jgi:hypothetical protein
MSFREKSAWISFVTILVVFGAYFWNIVRITAHRIDNHTGFVISIGLISAFVLLEIALHVIAVMQSPKEAQAPRDEREQLIQLKATNVAFWVLMACALACVGMLHVTRNAWQITQHVLLAVVVAALVKSGVQIMYFRRGV